MFQDLVCGGNEGQTLGVCFLDKFEMARNEALGVQGMINNS